MTKIIGNSPAMQKLSLSIKKMATTDAPVHISGESGTGKELAARALHEQSNRSEGPFHAINCAALPNELIISELFGHEKGSFTGAHQRNVGHIESANGGSIFLDEIGELSLESQASLLRFLQESTIERIGGVETIKVDTRVICATNVNLEKAMAEGRFRADLYYRLNVLNLELPPLRERHGDIELLAEHYLSKFAQEHQRDISGFQQTALELLNAYEWPGNIRELVNRVRRAAVMCDGQQITIADLDLDRRKCERKIQTLAEARADADKHAVEMCMHYTRNNIAKAARALGVSRLTLYRLLEKHGELGDVHMPNDAQAQPPLRLAHN